MITIPSNTKLYLAQESMDFRKGFNGTAAFCRLKIGINPLEGGLFIFLNKNRTMVRCYFFDGHGEWLITKRKAQGRFCWIKDIDINNFELTHLILLLRGADISCLNLPKAWKEINC